MYKQLLQATATFSYVPGWSFNFPVVIFILCSDIGSVSQIDGSDVAWFLLMTQD